MGRTTLIAKCKWSEMVLGIVYGALGAIAGVCEGVTKAALDVICQPSCTDKVSSPSIALSAQEKTLHVVRHRFRGIIRLGIPLSLTDLQNLASSQASPPKLCALQEPEVLGLEELQTLLETLQLTTEGGSEPVLKACVRSWLSDDQDGVSMITIIDLVRVSLHAFLLKCETFHAVCLDSYL